MVNQDFIRIVKESLDSVKREAEKALEAGNLELYAQKTLDASELRDVLDNELANIERELLWNNLINN